MRCLEGGFGAIMMGVSYLCLGSCYPLLLEKSCYPYNSAYSWCAFEYGLLGFGSLRPWAKVLLTIINEGLLCKMIEPD
jgi:hypothetical protein